MTDLLLPLQATSSPAALGTTPATYVPPVPSLVVRPRTRTGVAVALVRDLVASLLGAVVLVLAPTGPHPQVVACTLLLWCAVALRPDQVHPSHRRRRRLERAWSVARPASLVALAGCVAAEVPGRVLPLALSSGTNYTAGQALALACSLALPVAAARLVSPASVPAPILVAGASAVVTRHVTDAFRRGEPGAVVREARIVERERGEQRPRIEDGDAAQAVTAVRCGFADLPAVAASTGARTVVVVPSGDEHPALVRRLQWELETTGCRLLLAPGPLDVSPTRAATWHVDGQPLLEVRPSRHGAQTRRAIAVVERVVALVALVLLAPLLLGVAMLVRLDSPGPAIFRQTRVGRRGACFTMHKFRTMRTEPLDPALLVNEADGVLFKIRQDPRITRVGAVLRRYSLDELPQLFDVVLGSMSLVGPRPALPEEVAAYEEDTSRRLAVRPGITGLWQVSGRSDLSWQETVRLDLSYVDNWSLGLDLSILWRTVGAVVSHRGAY